MRLALLQMDARLGDPEANGRALEAAYASEDNTHAVRPPPP